MYSVFGISFSDYPKPKPFSPHLSHYCSVPSPHLSNLHRFTVNNFKMCFPFLFSFRKSITFLEWVKFVERIYWRGTWTVCGSNFLRTMQCFQELGAYLQSKKCLIFSPKDQFCDRPFIACTKVRSWIWWSFSHGRIHSPQKSPVHITDRAMPYPPTNISIS